MIRSYQPTDFDQILGIYNVVKLDRSKLGNPDYEATIQKNGFLLGLDTSEDIKNEIQKSYLTIVYEENSQILGYLIADHGDDQKFIDDEYKTWFDTDLRNFYYQNKQGMTLATVAVDPTTSQKGIATALLTYLEKELAKNNIEYLFSIICLAPLTNCATLLWHTKHGFHRLAMGHPRKLWNLNNYVGVLLYKKL